MLNDLPSLTSLRLYENLLTGSLPREIGDMKKLNFLAIGNSAMDTNTTGSNNVAISTNSLNKNITGTGNVAIGRDALRENLAGSDNVFKS